MQDAQPSPDIDIPSEDTPQEEQAEGLGLDALLEQTNIADQLDEEELQEIGDEVYKGYLLDVQSKSEWDKSVDDWVGLAAQMKDQKTFPWPKASNVKYPLLSTAAMQFAARAYPSLIPSDGKLVQMDVIGADQDGQKAAKADRLAKHMSYQILKDMPDWEEEMDRLLIQLPIVGCLFKKTYFDPIQKRNTSRLLGPKDLIVNYWARGLDSAYRKTEVIPMTKNELKSMQNAKLFLDVELPDPKMSPELPTKANVHGTQEPSTLDVTTPYVILEQHTYYDLDDDGYAEPYVITIERDSKKVLRVVARWDSDGVRTTDDGDLICIEPVEYYTKYGFIPNPDGGFYDVGFGHLLGPLNESANTIINQLIDAGTLSNLQSGFIGKGLRIKMGETKFQPGEWKAVNATGDDIKKQIFPLPTKEPSETLFKLLGLIIESTKELASVAEIFTGKMPGQNTPATTTMATIEQGMKVFTAIYKRVYRSMASEFRKLFRLNGLYPENLERAAHVIDMQLSVQDYNPKTYDVCPSADPTAVSASQKMLKAQELMNLLPLGTLNVMEVTKRNLEAQEQPNMELLMANPTPQKDPKAEAMQQQAALKEKESAQKMQMERESHQLKMAMQKFEAMMDQQKAMMEMKMDEQMRAMDMRMKEMESSQNMRHSQFKHQQAMQQTLEKAAMQRETARANQQGSGSGVGKPSSDRTSQNGGSRKNQGSN